MTKMAASKVRENFSDALNRVAYAGERVVIHRRGKEIAAIVSSADLALLEKLEDQADIAAARAALAEMKRTRKGPIPYEKVRKELGLR